MPTTETADHRGHIFISYRRDDARGASGRLYDWLRIGFGRESVFRDVHGIGVGKWREKIDQALARSAICVAVIGPRWANPENLQRLHDSSDMVRHELLTALTDEAVTMVPTLVEGADIPKVGELPAELRLLFDSWNVRPVTEDGWEDDIRRLIGEIADATSLAVGADLDTLLRGVGAAQARLVELEQERDLHAGQIEALRASVHDLTTKLAGATAKDRPALAAAFSALAKGDTLAAEDAFEREFQAGRLAREQETLAMADAARNVANLALLRDVRKAVRFYREALALVPQDAESSRLLGEALLLVGDLAGAEAAMKASLEAAVDQQDTWSEMAAQIGLGDIASSKGSLGDARQAFEAARTLAESRLKNDPNNGEWQRELSVSFNALGDVAVAQGRLEEAARNYGLYLATTMRLAESDPSNSGWQRDLSIAYDRLGRVALAQGELEEAARAYGLGLTIHQQLAESDPNNSLWQRDLSVAYEKFGDVAMAQGRLEDAARSFGLYLATTMRLAESDPSNSLWQRDLSISYNKLGDVAVAEGDREAAEQTYGLGLAIRQRLSESDPSNSDWQRDLSVSYDKLGDVAVVQGELKEAARIYGLGQEITKRLAESDLSNSLWQRDLSISYHKLGDLAVAQGELKEAARNYDLYLAITKQLAESDPSNTEWQRDLSISYDRLGNVAMAEGELEEAARTYGLGLNIRQRLTESDPRNSSRQRGLSVSYEKLGDVAMARGELEEATQTYGQGLAITQRLAESDPSNSVWQRDLWVSYWKLANLAVLKTNQAGALVYWQQAFDVLSGIKQRGLHLSPGDEQSLEILRQRIGGVES